MSNGRAGPGHLPYPAYFPRERRAAIFYPARTASSGNAGRGRLVRMRLHPTALKCREIGDNAAGLESPHFGERFDDAGVAGLRARGVPGGPEKEARRTFPAGAGKLRPLLPCQASLPDARAREKAGPCVYQRPLGGVTRGMSALSGDGIMGSPGILFMGAPIWGGACRPCRASCPPRGL